MQAIRFIPKSADERGPTIHRYIVGYSDQKMKAIWLFTKQDHAGGYFFYEDPDGEIEYPVAGVKYTEVEAKEAEYFETYEPGWENKAKGIRERRRKTPPVLRIIDHFPDDAKPYVVFNAKEDTVT